MPDIRKANGKVSKPGRGGDLGRQPSTSAEPGAERRKSSFGTRPQHDLDGVDGRSKNSLAAFIRRTLSAHDGVCNRRQLLQCVLEDPEACQLLKHGSSFSSALLNMKYSGFLEFEGDLVRRTSRRYGHMRR